VFNTTFNNISVMMMAIFHVSKQNKNSFFTQSLFKLGARGCHGRDHMVVGFTITYAISAYHI
jgi:hypothetical protein